MPKRRSMRIQFPLGGLNRERAHRQQPPFTTRDCSNVRPIGMIEQRERGGSRPGLVKSHADDIGTKVRLLSPMVLALGDVSTVEGVLIRAVDLALDVDCDYVSSFDADIPLAAGKSAYFKPEGIVRVKNGAGAEQPLYEYIVFGNRA